MLLLQPLIQFYNLVLRIKMSCDTSKTGLGAILEQQDGDLWLPVAYASSAITETKGRYAPIEKESLATHFACERFHQYIYRRPVQLETDHKPIVAIFLKIPTQLRTISLEKIHVGHQGQEKCKRRARVLSRDLPLRGER